MRKDVYKTIKHILWTHSNYVSFNLKRKLWLKKWWLNLRASYLEHKKQKYVSNGVPIYLRSSTVCGTRRLTWKMTWEKFVGRVKGSSYVKWRCMERPKRTFKLTDIIHSLRQGVHISFRQCSAWIYLNKCFNEVFVMLSKHIKFVWNNRVQAQMFRAVSWFISIK